MSTTATAENGVLTFSYERNLWDATGGSGTLQKLTAPVSGRVKWVTATVRTASNEDGFTISVENDVEDRMHDEAIFIAVNNRTGESAATSGSSDYSFQRGDVIDLYVYGLSEDDSAANLIVNIAYEGATEATPSYIQPDKRFG